MKNNLTLLLLSLMILGSFSVSSANIEITQIPTTWRLENYIGGDIAAYYTGSICASGALHFGPNASSEDKNRFWALIVTAKLNNSTVMVFYNDDPSANCEISSFALKEK